MYKECGTYKCSASARTCVYVCTISKLNSVSQHVLSYIECVFRSVPTFYGRRTGNFLNTSGRMLLFPRRFPTDINDSQLVIYVLLFSMSL